MTDQQPPDLESRVNEIVMRLLALLLGVALAGAVAIAAVASDNERLATAITVAAAAIAAVAAIVTAIAKVINKQ